MLQSIEQFYSMAVWPPELLAQFSLKFFSEKVKYDAWFHMMHSCMIMSHLRQQEHSRNASEITVNSTAPEGTAPWPPQGALPLDPTRGSTQPPSPPPYNFPWKPCLWSKIPGVVCCTPALCHIWGTNLKVGAHADHHCHCSNFLVFTKK